MEMIKVGSPMRGDDAASNGSAGEWEDDASPPCPEALWWVVLLNVLLAAAQILVGSTVKSLALVADGAHTLSDAFAAYVALKAESYDGAAYDERKFPFGYARASTIGALINVAALEALCFSIGLNAICRLVTPDTLGDLRALAIVSALGVGVNMFAATLTCCGVRGAHVHLPRGSSSSSYGRVATDAPDEEEPDDGEMLIEAACDCCAPGVGLGGPDGFDDDNDDGDPRPAASRGVGVGRTALAVHLLGDAATCAAVLAEALFLRFGAPRLPRRAARGLKRYLDPALSLAISVAIALAAWPVGSRAAKSLLGLSEPTEKLRSRALAVDGVARVDAAAIMVLRDQPTSRCGMARVAVDDAAKAVPAANAVRDLLRRRGAAKDRTFVDVHLTREAVEALRHARLAVPGAGWTRPAPTARTSAIGWAQSVVGMV